jgi:MraZ protein
MVFSTGEYSATLDDKGRISIPSRFREGIPENILVITKGIENCIWAHTPQVWEKVSAKLRNAASISIKKTNMVNHRFIFPSCEVEIDKAGRIAIPQTLREFAGLSKDCIVASDGNCIELWDAERLAAYQRTIDNQFVDVLEEMGHLELY